MSALLLTVVVVVTGVVGGAGNGLAAAPVAPDRPTPFVHPPDVHDPHCVIEIQAGDSLSLIADAMPDTAVTYGISRPRTTSRMPITSSPVTFSTSAWAIRSTTSPARRAATVPATCSIRPSPPSSGRSTHCSPDTECRELAVDGVSGPLTRQQLCAVRSAFGLPVSRADMVPGSAEEQLLMSATTLPANPGVPDRWVMIDKTCQIIFAGDSTSIVFIFPTSTGEPGYETRDEDGVAAFRFDPAVDNDGWHDSTLFPAAADNPLNGNMYKPVYFDDGQAIHGSYNVPPEPMSKGCARLLVEDHDALLAWLGLADATTTLWSPDRINLIVHVRGHYAPDP